MRANLSFRIWIFRFQLLPHPRVWIDIRRALGVLALATLATGCTPEASRPASAVREVAAESEVLRIYVNDMGQAYHRWCDGPHMLYTIGLGITSQLTLVPNDPRCTRTPEQEK